MYKLTLRRLRVKPSESVFIDDVLDHVEVATKLGIFGFILCRGGIRPLHSNGESLTVTFCRRDLFGSVMTQKIFGQDGLQLFPEIIEVKNRMAPLARHRFQFADMVKEPLGAGTPGLALNGAEFAVHAAAPYPFDRINSDTGVANE